ncbi:MAG: sel1 repeat family protein [Candidatus Riflebacteria bacterium]|nr:sel1 repeat family protein [Candidatus Riflebacteria bacterium]
MKYFAKAALFVLLFTSSCSIFAQDWSYLISQAKSGDAAEQIRLADVYAKAQSAASAAYWYKIAAEHGNVRACVCLGQRFERGGLFQKDLDKAEYWYLKGANLGDTTSLTLLGEMNEHARNNPAEAAKYYKQAAERGDGSSQIKVASMYHSGNGVTKNDREAAIWWTRASDQGLSEAMVALGALYEKGGIGIDKDLLQACIWYDLAGRYGQPSYLHQFRDRCAKTLTMDQFTEASSLADKRAAKIAAKK